jgi:hypothetical protein
VAFFLSRGEQRLRDTKLATSSLENQCVSLRPLHGVFGHPMLRIVIDAHGTQFFPQS